MYSRLWSDIEAGIADIDRLFSDYATLVENSVLNEPNHIELAALATVLHSFYNGVEGIFTLIAKAIDGGVPSGEQSHRLLLLSVGNITDKRPAVISEQSRATLGEYMQFRHFFRHAYAFHISWPRMKPLVEGLTSAWESLKLELDQFISKLHN